MEPVLSTTVFTVDYALSFFERSFCVSIVQFSHNLFTMDRRDHSL